MTRKPLLDDDQMITKLKKLGIRFNIINEEKAKEILYNYTYFFKLGYFRKNFPRKSEKYNIEFSYLSDLASIDMQLRYLLLQMCLDIEHTLKTYIIRKVSEDSSEDGYSIMEDFYKSEQEKNRTFRNVGKMRRKMKNGKRIKSLVPYPEFEKYYNDPPIWVCLELMSYNQFIEFVHFYYKRKDISYLACASHLVEHVKDIRNMSAHSQPIIANLGNPKLDKTNKYLTRKGQEKYNLTFKQVQYIPIRNVFATFFVHEKYCSPGIRKNRHKDITKFKKRLNKHNYYSKYRHLSVTFNAFNKIFDNYKQD